MFPSLLQSVHLSNTIFRAPLPSSRVFKLAHSSHTCLLLPVHSFFFSIRFATKPLSETIFLLLVIVVFLASQVSFLCTFRIHKIIPCPSLPHCRAFVLIHSLFRNVPELFVRPTCSSSSSHHLDRRHGHVESWHIFKM